MKRVPWYVTAVLVAATCAVVGVIWDISWHRTIGRDTFWTPAHMMIYASGIIAGLSCGWLVLRTTFAGSDAERGAAVRFWGFRGPLGAWLCIWGALAMIVSAPFDNWWHNAYGLDVKVLSPPHVILALGFTGIELGAVLLVTALQNRAAGDDRRDYGLLLAYGFGILVLNMAIMGFEQIGFPHDAHNALYYLVCAAIFPILLVASARASSLRWPATTAALVYMGVTLIMVWLLPLFSATPKLAPVYRPLTHMVPPPFPLLLVVPAIVVDLAMRRFGTGGGGGRDWRLAAIAGLSFLAVLFVTQWFATIYLISPGSENFLFGAQRWNYNQPPGDFEHRFWNIRTDPVTPLKLGLAALLAMISSRLGTWLGNGLARVQR